MLPGQLFASLSFFFPAVTGSSGFFNRCPACPMVIFNFPSRSFMSVTFIEMVLPLLPGTVCCFFFFFYLFYSNLISRFFLNMLLSLGAIQEEGKGLSQEFKISCRHFYDIAIGSLTPTSLYLVPMGLITLKFMTSTMLLNRKLMHT